MPFDREAYADEYPFESHWLTLPGDVRMHYLDEGAGPVVLMVHGNPTWSFYFRKLVRELSSTHRVIVPDHVGCGLSDKPDDAHYPYRLERRVRDLQALVEHLGIERLSLVVHDWGGMIGIASALDAEWELERVVALNTAAFLLPEGKGLPVRLWLLRHLSLPATVAVRGGNAFAGLATRMATAKGLPRRIRRALTAPYDSWRNRIATLRFVQDIPLTPRDPSYEWCKRTEDSLERLKDIPLLIAWGEKDFVFDLEFLAEWERRFPDADVHRFPDAGHYVLEDAAEEVVPLVADFLRRDR